MEVWEDDAPVQRDDFQVPAVNFLMNFTLFGLVIHHDPCLLVMLHHFLSYPDLARKVWVETCWPTSEPRNKKN